MASDSQHTADKAVGEGIEIAFYNSTALLWVLKGIAELIPEATMTINATEISLNGMDSVGIGMFDIHMRLNKLASRVVCADDTQAVIGFRTTVFKNYLSMFKNNSLHLEYNVSKNEDVLILYQLLEENVQATGSKRKQRQDRQENEMKLLHIDSEELSVPDRNDWIEIDIEAIKWKKIIKDFNGLDYEKVTLICTSEHLQYNSSGDNGTSKNYLYPKEDNISISAGPEATDSTKISLSLKKMNEGVGKIEVRPGDRMKIRIIGGETGRVAGFDYYLGDPADPECTLVYYLAAKIDDEDL